MGKIVVTGATGMVGAHLVAELLNTGADSVTVALRSSSKVEKLYKFLDDLGVENYVDKIVVERVELLNPHDMRALLADCDKLFHCAAEVSFSDTRSAEVIENNTHITSILVSAALESGVGVMVHVSSIAAIGDAEYPAVTSEDNKIQTLANSSAYGISKFYAENVVWKGIKMGLNAVIVNPSVILGIGDWNGSGSASLFKMAARGIPFYTQGIVGYVDVRDVVKAMVALSNDGSSWGRRYLLSAYNLSYKDFITAVAAKNHVRKPFIKAGKTIMSVACFCDQIMSKFTGKPAQLSRSMIRTSATKTLYYSDRIRQQIGLEYRTLDDTLDFITQHYQNS